MKPDAWIARTCKDGELISPYVLHQQSEGIVSYGLSSFGYDLRLGYEFKRIIPGVDPIDPHNINPDMFVPFDVPEGDAVVMQPGEFLLGCSLERIRMPRDVIAICLGKSTYARCGLLVNMTPAEPEWEGILTLELYNMAPRPLMVYTGEGICQLVFSGYDEDCCISYADRQGKYQKQTGVTIPRV